MSEPTQEYKDQLKIIDEAEHEAEQEADISSVNTIEKFRQYFLDKQRLFFPKLEQKVSSYSQGFVTYDLNGLGENPHHSEFLTKIKRLGSNHNLDNIKNLIYSISNVCENLDERLPNNNLTRMVIGYSEGFTPTGHTLRRRLYRAASAFDIPRSAFNPHTLINSAVVDILSKNQDIPGDSFEIPYSVLGDLSLLGRDIADYLPYEKITDQLRKARVITKSTNTILGYTHPFDCIDIRMEKLINLIGKELQTRNPLSFLSIKNSSFPVVSIQSSPGQFKRSLYFPELKTNSLSNDIYEDYLVLPTVPSRLKFVNNLTSFEVSYTLFPRVDDPEWLKQFNRLYTGNQPLASFSLVTLFVPQTITSYRYLRYMQHKVSQSLLNKGIKILMPQDYHGYNADDVFQPLSREEKLEPAKKSLSLSNMTGLAEPIVHVPVTIIVANQSPGVIALSYIQEIMTCLENVDRLYLESYWTT